MKEYSFEKGEQAVVDGVSQDFSGHRVMVNRYAFLSPSEIYKIQKRTQQALVRSGNAVGRNVLRIPGQRLVTGQSSGTLNVSRVVVKPYSELAEEDAIACGQPTLGMLKTERERYWGKLQPEDLLTIWYLER